MYQVKILGRGRAPQVQQVKFWGSLAPPGPHGPPMLLLEMTKNVGKTLG